jgi:exopolyphosphatase/guanosine-5'-triphosphate,3'-diphosphate pyrophosphatase
MPRAAIDIGSNSLLLLVVGDDGRVLHDEARVVGLGRGLGDRGLIASDRLEAAEVVLGAYVATAARLGVEAHQIRAVATSAARRAMNAPTWVSRLQRTHGLRVKIISGDDEARLSWLGACRDLDLPTGPLLVIDLGGGSTEVVLGEGERILGRISLEIGSVRLTEQFLRPGANGAIDPVGLARLRNHVDVEVAKVHLDPMPRTVVGVAGTVTTLATLALGLRSYDAALVHGSKITRADLVRAVDQLLPATPEQRRALVPASPERADFLVAGAVILDRVLAASRRQQLVVSDRGLRYGAVVSP